MLHTRKMASLAQDWFYTTDGFLYLGMVVYRTAFDRHFFDLIDKVVRAASSSRKLLMSYTLITEGGWGINHPLGFVYIENKLCTIIVLFVCILDDNCICHCTPVHMHPST